MELDYKRIFEETIELSRQVTASIASCYVEDYHAATEQVVDLWDRMKAFRSYLADDNLFFKCDAAYTWSSGMIAVMMEMQPDTEAVDGFSGDDPMLATRAACCQQLLDTFTLDSDRERQCRETLADMYLALGNQEGCDKQYELLLSEDPTWGEGYIEWECSCEDSPDGIEKAIDILKRGLAQSVLDTGDVDRAEMLNELIGLCTQTGDAEGAALYQGQFQALQPTLPRSSRFFKQAPVRSQKIGRNAPCPCGSGTKYKHCCGAYCGQEFADGPYVHRQEASAGSSRRTPLV